jgi:hypothetical protein
MMPKSDAPFFRRIPEACWRQAVRAQLLGCDINKVSVIFSFIVALSRQKTRKTHFVRFATGSVLAMAALLISSKFGR